MSHFLFGDFISDNINENYIEIIKKGYSDCGLIIYLDMELQFYSDIEKMLALHMSNNTTKFCITSNIQKYNSSDVLFPYDKYDRAELFPNKDDRFKFNELVNKNLQIAKRAIENMIQKLQLKSIRFFVVDDYEDDFRTVQCSLDDMFLDISSQAQISFFLESTIYEINLDKGRKEAKK